MEGSVLGIDIGSVYLGIVQMAPDKTIIRTSYLPHHGKVLETLQEQLQGYDFSRISGVVSPSGHEWFSAGVLRTDPQVSIIRAAVEYSPGVRSVLVVGAEKFMLIKLDEKGGYQGAHYSTSCAAGTGSFLDQQASRLKLKDIRELTRVAVNNKDDLPEIASRCAVFAKTDLIHAQQEGYSLSAICDSLTRGLARNIADTLFGEEKPITPMVFAGGVAHNTAVVRHLEKILGIPITVHKYSHLFNVLGACLAVTEGEASGKKFNGMTTPGEFLVVEKKEKEYYFPPLSLKLSDYPDFTAEENKKVWPEVVHHTHPVEVTIYRKLPAEKEIGVYLGIDIGSTSTKAVLLTEKGEMLAGFYTYTLGQPVQATQAIFEILHRELEEKHPIIRFLGVGTTGSGRKFIGKVIGADAAIDEISTHARAAYDLDPEVDTIIEIGGQDAKFTLVRNGNVIFSQMNSVCAAGTGSFIEEQAVKLGVKLKDYSAVTGGAPSPLASDRCTVFMERDINHYQSTGYSVPEILSAVLHSVRENYLQKVAVESSIGNHIAFQGATARNKALVAAFEEKLQKRIYVSPYCHLTGAMGTALIMKDEKIRESSFKGLGIFRENIEFKTEICRYCNNRCRISVTEIQGEKIAWGFLCGRDYNTVRFVDRNTSGFDLMKSGKKVERKVREHGHPVTHNIKIGIPGGLYMSEETVLWKDFFSMLGFKTVTAGKGHGLLKTGKRMSGAEFCAPMYAMHGQVKWLSENSDYVFLPQYLTSRSTSRDEKNKYCYYSQYAPSVIYQSAGSVRQKAIMPFLHYAKGEDSVIRQLYRMIIKLPLKSPPLMAEVERAYHKALELQAEREKWGKRIFKEEFSLSGGDISVVFVGRPYLVLSEGLNKDIPGIFASKGIKTFFMDMLPDEDPGTSDVDSLIRIFPWYYASRIMSAARKIGETPLLYPVFITAFKCSPDSFVLEYFKRYMDKKGKPYLILQVDEHDSSVGYETRIEAGIRSFRNHYKSGLKPVESKKPVIVQPVRDMRQTKTLLFPNWDDLSCRFLTANLRRAGFDVRLLDMEEMSIRKSMATNTGQCIPLNIIVQDFADYIKKHDMDPAQVALWLVDSHLSCNFPLFPYYAKTLFEKYGRGMEKAEVYAGDFTHIEISVNTTYYAYFAYMFGGYLRRLGNHFRPREVSPGETGRTIARSADILEQAFLGDISFDQALKTVSEWFAKIETKERDIPKVAIFGDFFVRDNDVVNQHLVKVIENAGGEVINTPYNEYARLTAENALRRMAARGETLEAIGFRALLKGIKFLEKKYYAYFERFLGKEQPISSLAMEKHLEKYRIHPFQAGESYDNILKIYYLLDRYPDIALFVQANPAFCCPSLVTEAMKQTIEKETGVPIITITYDGTTEGKNGIVIPYLHAYLSDPAGRKGRNIPVKEKKSVRKDIFQVFDRKQIIAKFKAEKNPHEN